MGGADGSQEEKRANYAYCADGAGGAEPPPVRRANVKCDIIG